MAKFMDPKCRTEKNAALNISFLSYKNDKYTFKNPQVQVEIFSPPQILLLKSTLYCRLCLCVYLCMFIHPSKISLCVSPFT